VADATNFDLFSAIQPPHPPFFSDMLRFSFSHTLRFCPVHFFQRHAACSVGWWLMVGAGLL
jgi:hypothetical protein